jgi:hypothetical protein
MQIAREDLTYVIDHVFLPLKLPEEHDPKSTVKDTILANYIMKASQSFCDTLKSSQDELALSTWKMLNKMLRNVSHLHREDRLRKAEVQAALLNMQTNGMFTAVAR